MWKYVSTGRRGLLRDYTTSPIRRALAVGVAADNRSRGHVDVTPRYTVSRSRLTSRYTEGQCFYNF